jgi:hypothetical protein
MFELSSSDRLVVAFRVLVSFHADVPQEYGYFPCSYMAKKALTPALPPLSLAGFADHIGVNQMRNQRCQLNTSVSLRAARARSHHPGPLREWRPTVRPVGAALG